MQRREDVTDRTLYHLCACQDVARTADALREAKRVGPSCSTWADLLASIMEGLERDWVNEAYLTREDGVTVITWNATERGERAMRAFRERLKRADVSDETGEE